MWILNGQIFDNLIQKILKYVTKTPGVSVISFFSTILKLVIFGTSKSLQTKLIIRVLERAQVYLTLIYIYAN